MITKALIDFITTERLSGASYDTITKKLKEKGWSERDVQDGFDYAEHPDVPLPPRGLYGMFTDLLSLSLRTYSTRWKRFVEIGVIYIGALVIGSFVVVMTNLSRIALLLNAIQQQDLQAVLAITFPGFLPAVFIFLLIQIWFTSTLYVVAQKEGTGAWERAREGLSHVGHVFGIKLFSMILSLLTFAPSLSLAFYTNNSGLFYALLPLTLIAFVLLSLYMSLALPAYFSGTPWTHALRESMHRLKKKNLFPYVMHIGFFGLTMTLVSLFFAQTGILSTLVSIAVLHPVQAIFFLSLYKSLPDHASVIEERGKRARKKK